MSNNANDQTELTFENLIHGLIITILILMYIIY